jgi:hypothetical protein
MPMQNTKENDLFLKCGDEGDDTESIKVTLQINENEK